MGKSMIISHVADNTGISPYPLRGTPDHVPQSTKASTSFLKKRSKKLLRI
jgi:hypothetical protein